MSCKGLKGRKLKKCLKEYEAESTKRFPDFNKKTDTIITTKGKGSRSAVLSNQSYKLSNYGQGSGNSNNSMYSDGTYIARNKVKKK